MKLGENVEVLTVTSDGLWAFNKPAGILSHPNKPGEEVDSLINAPYNYEEEVYTTEDGPMFLLHRLDGPTSGVILATPYSKLADQIKELIRARKMKKYYNAIVSGFPRKEKELWRDYIGKQKINEGRAVRAIGGGAPAESQMLLLQKFHTPVPSALLELRPLTGRTHQLRIQCANRKYPIIGDGTYGDFKLNRELKAKQLLLHSRAIEIPEMNFLIEAPLPKAFIKWMSAGKERK